MAYYRTSGARRTAGTPAFDAVPHTIRSRSIRPRSVESELSHARHSTRRTAWLAGSWLCDEREQRTDSGSLHRVDYRRRQGLGNQLSHQQTSRGWLSHDARTIEERGDALPRLWRGKTETTSRCRAI